MIETLIRTQLADLLAWKDAHVDFDSVVDGIPAEARGAQPANLPYSPWQLLEHLRITQHDILDFCRNAEYEEMKWPGNYWPVSAAPPDDESWEESVRGYKEDRAALQQLAADPGLDLTARIPHGDGQTYFRELVLAADHNAYHLGELVVLRRLLGTWS